MKIIKYIKDNFFVIALIIFSGFLFFYRLDYNTLASWDEAWYAEISKQMVKTGDFIFMMWNGKPYYDHPPMGFWLMTLSYKVFGVSEFSTRFPSALMGVLTVVLIYKTAVELFGKKLTGFISALILGTSVWYVIRVRSGNLESVFVFFFILTVYLSLKSSKNFKWFPLAMVSFGSLILSKTLVGVSAAPLILYLNFKQMINFKKNIFWFLLGLVLLFLVVYPWYHLNSIKYIGFYENHFVHVGMRDKSFSSYFNLKIQKPLFYLHMGVRTWYKLWQVALILGLMSLLFNFVHFIKSRNKQSARKIYVYIFLIIWTLVILYPFLTSDQTELWHLIPTYLPVSLLISYAIFDIGFYLFKRFKLKLVFPACYLLVFVLIATIQFYKFYKEVYPVSKYIPDQVDIAKKLKKYNGKFFADNEFLPEMVFYSDKNIDSLVYESTIEKSLTSLYSESKNKVYVILKNWVITDLDKTKYPYKLLEKNNTYSVITKI